MQDLVSVTWETQSEASFIDISSIASFKLFFGLLGCGNIALFRTVPWST